MTTIPTTGQHPHPHPREADPATTTSAPAACPDVVVAATDVRHGLRILELGEEGEHLVVLGHHDDRRTVAAINAHARMTWGEGLHSMNGTTYTEVVGELRRHRAALVHGCGRGIVRSNDERSATRSTRARPCLACATGDSPWGLTWAAAAQTDPAAFDVTVWDVW